MVQLMLDDRSLEARESQLLGFAAADDVPEPRCVQSGDYSLCIEKGFPQEGDPCLVKVTQGRAPAGGVELVVTYRPNSEVTRIETIGTTDASGQIGWTPSDAGIATLEAHGDGVDPLSMTLSVKFRSPPTLGIIMLMIAEYRWDGSDDEG